MTTSNFNLRGVPPEVMSFLKRQAKELNISVNVLILRLIEQGIGFGGKTKQVVHHDLDFLIGTWSPQESKEFNQSVKKFENLDKELWK